MDKLNMDSFRVNINYGCSVFTKDSFDSMTWQVLGAFWITASEHPKNLNPRPNKQNKQIERLLGPWIVESCLATTKIALDRPKNCSIFTFHKVWEIGVCIMRQFQVRLKLKIVASLHIGLISTKMSGCFLLPFIMNYFFSVMIL